MRMKTWEKSCWLIRGGGCYAVTTQWNLFHIEAACSDFTWWEWWKDWNVNWAHIKNSFSSPLNTFTTTYKLREFFLPFIVFDVKRLLLLMMFACKGNFQVISVPFSHSLSFLYMSSVSSKANEMHKCMNVSVRWENVHSKVIFFSYEYIKHYREIQNRKKLLLNDWQLLLAMLCIKIA